MPDYNIGEILANLELDMIKNLRSSMQSGNWQASRYKALKEFQARNKALLAQYPINKELQKQLKEANEKAKRKIQSEMKLLNKEQVYSAIDDKKFRALAKSVGQDFNKAEHAMLRQMDDVYRKTIFNTEIELNTGTLSMDQAIDKATKSFLEKGINCIQYKNGNRVNIADYSEMALRTATRRATLIGEGEVRQQYGVSTVLVSQYGACSNICLPWQGRVYIDDVYSDGKPNGEYPLLSEAIAAGLYHPNCRHRHTTFFPEINRLPTPMNTKPEVYEHEQEQRYNERMIRKYKRLQEGSCDEENQKKYGNKVSQWQERQRELIKKYPNELRRDYSREQTRGA